MPRKTATSAAAAAKKKAAPTRAAATKKANSNTRATRSSKKAAAPKKTKEEEQPQQETSEESAEESAEESEEDQQEKDQTAETTTADDESDEETFKIHTPKQAAAAPAAPTPVAKFSEPKWEDEEEDDSSDSDAAPEAVSLSSSKEKILDKQDKEKAFLAKVQADQKAKRRARDQQLKQQKEEAKQRVAQKEEEEEKAKTQQAQGETDEATSTTGSTGATTRSGLPALLPMDILESVADMEEKDPKALQPVAGQKRKMHMRPEDFALLELELEMKKEARERKKLEKVQRNVGPVTVKMLDQTNLPKGQAIPETIVDFRKQHFFGNKIQRKNAVLNLSQRNIGAASQFRRHR